MIKIFVADDENLIRDGIRNCVEHHEAEYSICGEAPDGELAIPLIQELKPDVLIADVRMPFINGLELSTIVKKTMPWVHIIILSGHDEFTYAQQALMIGVDAYILKPVNSEKLLQTLDEVRQRIEKEKHEYLNIEKMLERDEVEKTIIREHFLSRLVTGKASINEVMEFSQKYDMEILAKYYMVSRVELLTLNADELEKIRVLGSRLFENQNHIIWFIKGADLLVCIIKGDTEDAVREQTYETAQILRHQLHLYLNLEISVGIGGMTDRIGGIANSYREAREVLSGIRVKKNDILGFEDVKSQRFLENTTLLLDVPTIEKLRHITFEDIPAVIEKQFHSLDNAQVDSVLYRYYLLMDMFIAAVQLTKGQVRQEMERTPQQIFKIAESWEECLQYATAMLELMINDRVDEERYSKEIRMAKDYINQNYSDPSLSLYTVSKRVGFSPNHFSTVFSQETGETFIEYLTKRRIMEAKKMILDTDHKITDIAFQVGYSDSHYFSYVFKKKIGKSPKEFKLTEKP
ncbi:MAG: response regulator [Lachnospiraceae bacterium]